jgi:hypothetical protein
VSKVIWIELCPMQAEIAFALTPAAISSEANVWRAS